MQEGDLVGALQKTLDLIGQLSGAAQRGPLGADLVPTLDEADRLLRRGVVEAGYRWAVSGVPEVDEEDRDRLSWDVPIVESEPFPAEQPPTRRGPRRPARGKPTGRHRLPRLRAGRR